MSDRESPRARKAEAILSFLETKVARDFWHRSDILRGHIIDIRTRKDANETMIEADWLKSLAQIMVKP